MSPFSRSVAAAVRLVAASILPGAVFAADIGAVKESGVGINGFRPLVTDDRPAAPLLAPASSEGQARIKQFKIAPGLKVDLWAAEPMLANPVAFSVDEQGRVWTSETYRYRTSVLDIRHYMFMLEDDLASRSIDDRLATIRKWFGPEGEKALSRETEVIRLIEDTQHTGKADKSTIVADGLNSPLDGIASGVLARYGQLWFTDIPSVWRFAPAGASRDSKPVPGPAPSPLASRPNVHLKGFEATELLRGWGVRFSFTGHDLHGLKFGPDGRLYFSVGDRGTHVVTQEGTVIDLPDEGAVFRCEPDGSKLEVFARGLRNPQELAFDEYGNLFTGDNDSDQGDRERWEYVVEGGDYGWRVGYQHAPLGNAGPWNMERLWVPHFEGQAAYIIPPVANIGDGPSGLVYDYGTSFPKAWQGRFLLADFKGTSAKSGIYSLLNRPKGAGFELVAHDEFVWNVLVPDVDLGPDGSIWFADWHEGWPKSNKGRLYRAYFPDVVADPVVQQTAKLLREGMTKRGDAELLSLLSHRDMRVRQDAQFELAARGTKSFPAFRDVALKSKHTLERLHAIWGIGQIARVETPKSDDSFAKELSAMMPLLSDADPKVRATTARLLGDAGLFNAIGEVGLLLSDPDRAVQFAALQAQVKLQDHRRHSVTQFSTRQKSVGAAAHAAGSKAEQFAADRLGTTARGFNPDILVAALLKSSGESDPWIRSTAANLFAVRQLAPGTKVRLSKDIVTHASAEVRMAALLSYRILGNVEISQLLSDASPLLVLEAARAINDVPIPAAYPALASLADAAKLDPLLQTFSSWKIGAGENASAGRESQPTDGRVAIHDVRADQPLPWGTAPIDQLTPMLLRVVNANFREGSSKSAERLATLATRSDLSDLIRSEALFALGTWAKPHPRDRIVGTFRPLPARDASPAREALQRILPTLVAAEGMGRTAPRSSATTSKPGALLVAACEAVAQLELTSASSELAGLVRNASAPVEGRVAALRAMAKVSQDKSEISELIKLSAADTSEPLRLEASKLNAELNPNDAAGQLAAKLSHGSLAEQQSAFTSLGTLKSDAADAILAEWLDKLMKREVPNEVMLDLVEAAGKRNAAAVKSRLEAYGKWKLPQDHLTPYREALNGGDAARGRKIFYENAAVACTRCHHIGNDGGGNAGPVLDGIASRQPREYLLESIVFPNKQIAPGFETATVSMKNGTAYAGVLKRETDSTLILLSPEDGEVSLKKSDISSREKGLSGMPEGLGQLLSRQDLRDVIEFLGTLK